MERVGEVTDVICPGVQGFRRSAPCREVEEGRPSEIQFPRQIDNSLAFHLLSIEFRPGSFPTLKKKKKEKKAQLRQLQRYPGEKLETLYFPGTFDRPCLFQSAQGNFSYWHLYYLILLRFLFAWAGEVQVSWVALLSYWQVPPVNSMLLLAGKYFRLKSNFWKWS